MSGKTLRLVKSCVSTRAGAAILAVAAIGAVPAASFADDRGERYGRKRDADESRREREREYHRDRDDHRGGAGFRIDVDIRGGSWERVPPPTHVYEERVWVEPVYRTVCDRVWVPATYRTVSERVWVEPVVQCVDERVWVPDRYEIRHVVCYERGHYETHKREVVISTGHYEERTREELVCAAHWETVERQELVTPGHWETRHVAAAPCHEPSPGTRIAFRW